MDDSQDGAENTDDSNSLVIHTAISTEIQKWPPGDDWEEGYHHSKSTRFNYASVAPQQAISTPDEQVSAFASQCNVLNAFNTFLLGGLVYVYFQRLGYNWSYPRTPFRFLGPLWHHQIMSKFCSLSHASTYLLQLAVSSQAPVSQCHVFRLGLTINTSKSSWDSTPRTYEHGIGEGSMTSFVSFNMHLLIINLTHVLILL